MEIKLTHKVALYQSSSSDWLTVLPFSMGGDKETFYGGYVRVSAPIEVTFEALPSEDITASAVAALDAERETVVKKFSAALARIDGRKAEYLALTVSP